MEREIQCPNCGSMAVNKVNTYAGLAILLLLTCGVLMWIPILGWVATPVAFLLFVGFSIAGLASKKRKATCKTCNFSWEVDK